MSIPNINPQYFLTLFPEYKHTHETRINAYINIASVRVPLSVWGLNTQYATALLVAHMLATAGPQGGGPAGGALTAEQVGDLSRSFATVGEPGSGDADMRTTRYGIDFVALRKETFVTARSAYMPIHPPFPRC